MNAELIEIVEWLDDKKNKVNLHDKVINEINKLLNEEISLRSCAMLAFELSYFSFWWVNVFLHSIYENKLHESRKNGAMMLECYHISMLLYVGVIDSPGGRARILISDIQRLFFLLLTFNRHEQALWLGGRTYLGDTPERYSGRQDEVWTLRQVSEWESLGGDEIGWRGIVTKLRRLIPGQKEKECSAGKLPDDPMFPYWQEKPLCGYMLRLWLVMSGQIKPEEVPAGHPECGIYDGLFRNWNNPAALEKSIIEACDYHVRRSTEDDDSDIPEFTLRPYNVIPFEILAYRNVRKRMGLETPFPAHPLLDSPFVKNLPEELPPSDDPLLQEVLAAVRKVLPDV